MDISINEARGQRFELEFAQDGFGALAGVLAGFVTAAAGDDQFVLHRVLPADQLSHRHRVAVGFQQQAAQHIGQVAAEFAGVDGVAPQFCQRCLG